MLTSIEMKSLVEEYVLRERVRQGIHAVDRTVKSELSGEAYGEIALLLDRQLMTTEVGYGSWTSLKDPGVLEAVYLLVCSRTRA